MLNFGGGGYPCSKLTWLNGKSTVFFVNKRYIFIYGCFFSHCHVSFPGCTKNVV